MKQLTSCRRQVWLFAALFCITNTAVSLAQELTQVDCMNPGMSEVYVHWMLPPEQSSQLTDAEYVKRILFQSPNVALARCGASRLSSAQDINVTIGPGRGSAEAIQYLRSRFNIRNRQWTISNFVLDRAKQEQQEAERKSAEQQRLAAIAAAKDAVRQQFITANAVQAFANMQQLQANVFLYKDKTVAVSTRFDQMTSPTEALFGQLFVTDVPSTEFTAPGQRLVLALKVLGLKPVQILGTSVNLPYGSYVGVYRCTQFNCADFF